MFFRSKSVYENEKKEETTSLICSVSLCIQTYLNSDLFSNCFYLFLSILIYVENTLYYYYCKNKLYTIAEFPMRWGTQYFPRCHHSSYVESCWWCSSSHSFSCRCESSYSPGSNLIADLLIIFPRASFPAFLSSREFIRVLSSMTMLKS